jgi:hypothetical protein
MRPPPGLTWPQNCAASGLQAKYHCRHPRCRAPGCRAAGGGASGCWAAGGGAVGCCASGGAVPDGCASCAIAPELANMRMAATGKANLVMLAFLQGWAAHTRAREAYREPRLGSPRRKREFGANKISCQHDRHDRAMNNLRLGVRSVAACHRRIDLLDDAPSLCAPPA